MQGILARISGRSREVGQLSTFASGARFSLTENPAARIRASVNVSFRQLRSTFPRKKQRFLRFLDPPKLHNWLRLREKSSDKNLS